MGLVDRVILTIYTFALAFISLLSVLLSLGWEEPERALRLAMTTQSGRVAVGLAGLVFFAVSVRLLYFAFHRPNRARAVVHQAELGEVRVSLEAVESLISRVARGVKGVREARPHVRPAEGGLDVRLVAAVSPDVNIPELSRHLQEEIARYVRNVVGVAVTNVDTFVENITSESRRARVE
ncbi:MAG: alkaline shock response membrane anchor protein AmaP [Clostridia bacterium]|nr:alkaline shock response membrane anchor protein AmaP [Clostridia bacterium]